MAMTSDYSAALDAEIARAISVCKNYTEAGDDEAKARLANYVDGLRHARRLYNKFKQPGE